MSDHIIETEEHSLYGDKKTYLLKRVYSKYIFYDCPYIINEETSKKIREIFIFSSVENPSLYLDTRFDGNEVVSYDVCHQAKYNDITDEGLHYLYNTICDFSECLLMKTIREKNIDCRWLKTTVETDGSVSSLQFIVRSEDLIILRDYFNFGKLIDLVNIFENDENILPSWIIKVDRSGIVSVGFSDNISPDDNIEEYILPEYYNIDWYECKKHFYSEIMNIGLLHKNECDFILDVGKGKRPTELHFFIDDNQVRQILFKNIVTYKFEEI